jgi:3-dehydroquinate dehydratase-1
MEGVDGWDFSGHDSGMSPMRISFQTGRRWVVGSFGGTSALATATSFKVLELCDLAEIRLDLLAADGVVVERARWGHLAGVPLLFTARCRAEGGALELAVGQRLAWLLAALDDATLLDIEVASQGVLQELIAAAAQVGVPWLGSFHDFEKLPATAVLEAAAQQARAAGAAAFKVAARVDSPADVARLAEFQCSDQGLPLATMGMGPLAPVSRLLCAQYGSVLNYGYLGETPTAPGQWDCGLLKQAITRLAPL